MCRGKGVVCVKSYQQFSTNLAHWDVTYHPSVYHPAVTSGFTISSVQSQASAAGNWIQGLRTGLHSLAVPLPPSFNCVYWDGVSLSCTGWAWTFVIHLFQPAWVLGLQVHTAPGNPYSLVLLKLRLAVSSRLSLTSGCSTASYVQDHVDFMGAAFTFNREMWFCCLQKSVLPKWRCMRP